MFVVLIVEIMLTVAAWKEGWKWLAILPLAIAGLAGSISGVVMGAIGYDFISMMPYFILIHILTIIALICMAASHRDVEAPGFLQLIKFARGADKPAGLRGALGSYGDN